MRCVAGGDVDVGKRDISGAALRAWGGRWDVRAGRTAAHAHVSVQRVAAAASARVRWLFEVVAWWGLATLASFQEDATLLASVGGRGREGAGRGCETPFLNIGLDENEAELAEVDVDGGGPVSADGWEEV